MDKHKILPVLSCVVLATVLQAQNFCVPPKIQIHTTITSPDITKIQPHGIVAVSDGFWVTGTTTVSASNMDFLVARFNDSGRLLFMKRLGTSGDETSYPVAIAATSTGGCVIGGRSHEPAIGNGLAALAYFNRDGSNDLFRPFTDCKNKKCVAKESRMRIYSRWGEKLFDGPAIPGWDGTYLGKFVPEGYYVYSIQIIFDNAQSGNPPRNESGTVMVLSGKK